MGFGFLLYGYLMLIDYGMKIGSTSNIGIDIFPDILGYILFFIALRTLSRHALGFSRAKGICIPLIVLGSITFLGQLLALFGVGSKYVLSVLTYTEYLKYPLLLFFHIGILDGIHSLALDVDLPKLSLRAQWGKLLSVLYYVLGICLIIFEVVFPTPTGKAAAVYSAIGIGFQILFYVMFIYVFTVIFSSYRQICYEGDEQMDSPSNNPLNKLYEKYKKGKSDK